MPPDNYRPTPKNRSNLDTVGVTGSNPVSRTISLNPLDTAVISDIWANNLSLNQVWDAYRQTHLTLAISLQEAIDAYLAHLRDQHRSARYLEAMRLVLGEYRRLSGDHLSVSQHTTFTVECALKRMRARETKSVRLRSFFSWLHGQRMVPSPISIPSQAVPRPEVGILSVPQCSRLLEACPKDLLGHLWLCLYMGLRASEAKRTEGLEVRDGSLIVAAKASKTRTRRVMEMTPGHERYWSLVRPQVNLRRRFERLRDVAGIDSWPRNGMRHTAASHWLNHYQDEAKAALHLGHSPAMLHRHYKALVTRKESEDFFSLWSGR